MRGAAAVADEIPFRYGVAIDTTTPSDLPGCVGSDRVCLQGGGAVLSFIDGATVYDNALISGLYADLKAKGIAVQTKTKCAGGNDASALQKTAGGGRAVSLSTPGRYIHGPVSTVRVSDIEAMYRALVETYRYLKGRDERD